MSISTRQATKAKMRNSGSGNLICLKETEIFCWILQDYSMTVSLMQLRSFWSRPSQHSLACRVCVVAWQWTLTLSHQSLSRSSTMVEDTGWQSQRLVPLILMYMYTTACIPHQALSWKHRLLHFFIQNHQQFTCNSWTFRCTWGVWLQPLCCGICYCTGIWRAPRSISLRSRQNASPSVELFWEKADINVSIQQTDMGHRIDCKVSRWSPSILHL